MPIGPPCGDLAPGWANLGKSQEHSQQVHFCRPVASPAAGVQTLRPPTLLLLRGLGEFLTPEWEATEDICHATLV